MSRTAAARTTTRGAVSLTAVGLVVATAAIIGTLLYQSASSSAPSLLETHTPGAHDAVPQTAPPSSLTSGDSLGRDHDGATTGEDGALPDGVTVFDGEYPGITNLDPDLLDALRRAANDAADDGIAFFVESGWRSPEYQERLLRQAISTYGSRRKAALWVATPEASAHVTGDAVDLGPSDARTWLSRHGADYGLCQTYRNEPWHFELRPDAIDLACPRMYADPAHDPRMQP